MTPHAPESICRDDQPRRLLGNRHGHAPEWNGIDAVEVEPRPGPGATLRVYLIHRLTDEFRTAIKKKAVPLESVTITGGRRVRTIRVTRITIHAFPPGSAEDDYLELSVDPAGDYSSYTLTLNPKWFPQSTHDGPRDYRDRFDPFYSVAQFRFHPACPSADVPAPCPSPAPPLEPAIDYLARDYAGLRRLLLDRLAVVLPSWTERHPPDLGIALVELLAYVGDYLSYYQDAVATEAYLGTARLRTSVRRHVRLIDYPMHDGCNARAWVWVDVADPNDLKREQPPTPVIVPANALFLTADSGASAQAFEVLASQGRPPWGADQPITLHRDHGRIDFYTWNNQECRLPCGSTSATLRGKLVVDKAVKEPSTHKGEPHCEPVDPDRYAPELHLEKNNFLLLEEVLGPATGLSADANPARKHVVVLKDVQPGVDPVTGQHYVEVSWDERDALPFELCLSAIVPYADENDEDRKVICQHKATAVARGNVLLVDHGRTTTEPLPPATTTSEPASRHCLGADRPAPDEIRPDVYRPALSREPVTRRQSLQIRLTGSPPIAAGLLDQDVRLAMPQIWLTEGTHPWTARRDLLASGPRDRDFVAEMEDDGRTRLRFGDGIAGRRPTIGAAMTAKSRVGNGIAGNVGAGTITRIAMPDGGPNFDAKGYTITVHNPFPARGGIDPEPLEDVRQLAPDTFAIDQHRVVLPADYALVVARRFPEVQRAAASVRSIGGRDLVIVAVDFLGRVSAERRRILLSEIESRLGEFRLIGQRVRAREARTVPLAVDIRIQLRPTALRGPAVAALTALLGNKATADGRRGFFHPDNLTFGQGVAKSQLVALAQSVTGVESVEVTRLGRIGPVGNPAAPEFFAVGPLEIVRVDNDPNRREGGRLRLDVRGGR